jgi:hypothetical protein
VASQGQLVDPKCNVSMKGCSVRLLDNAPRLSLTGFKKRVCRAAGGIAFAFRTYFARGEPNRQVADLYCDLLYNKTSTYTAQFHHQAPGWVEQQCVQG